MKVKRRPSFSEGSFTLFPLSFRKAVDRVPFFSFQVTRIWSVEKMSICFFCFPMGGGVRSKGLSPSARSGCFSPAGSPARENLIGIPPLSQLQTMSPPPPQIGLRSTLVFNRRTFGWIDPPLEHCSYFFQGLDPFSLPRPPNWSRY